MSMRAPEFAQNMKPETVEGLQCIIRALNDSVSYHQEAAKSIDDDHVQKTFERIAEERTEIVNSVSDYVALANEEPVEDGSWMGSLRNIWTKFRAGLNAGDATVVLIEAERAEDVIVNKFKDILPELAGNPINDKLLQHFEKVKAGHDQVLALRNAYQNA